MGKVVVAGSINMDIVAEADKRPLAGETLFGNRMFTSPGGKGANQAVAASRLGADVYMIGCTGNDMYGKTLVENLAENRIDTSYVEMIDGVQTGCAVIVLAEGDNSILVIKGANECFAKELAERAKDIIRDADICILQNEIPKETLKRVVDICHENNVKILYNPAPYRELEKEYIDKMDFITPNEHEAAMMFGDRDIDEILKENPNRLIITLGSEGAVYFDGVEKVHVKACKVDAVDTTGAGDTFNGAFAVAISEEMNIDEAIGFANRASSISVTKSGAQGGMPYRNEI